MKFGSLLINFQYKKKKADAFGRLNHWNKLILVIQSYVFNFRCGGASAL